jgi:hypothetical protein
MRAADLTALPLFLCVVFAAAGEQVLRKVVASNLYHYRWFLVQLLCLGSALLYSLALLVSCVCNRRRPQWAGLPIRALCVLALLDSLHAMLLIIPSGVVPLPMTLAVPQLLGPLMLLGTCCIGPRSLRRLGALQWLGMLLVCVGVVVVVVPGVTAIPDAPCASYPLTGICGRTRAEVLANVALLACSVLPALISQLYKARLLSQHAVDKHAVVIGLSLLQFVAGLVLSPIGIAMQVVGATSLDGNIEPLPLVGTFESIRHGALCLAGVNSEPGDLCAALGAWIPVHITLYLLCCVGVPAALVTAMRYATFCYFVISSFVLCYSGS